MQRAGLACLEHTRDTSTYTTAATPNSQRASAASQDLDNHVRPRQRHCQPTL